MHARNRTWPLGSDPAERCRQRTLPVEGGDGSTLSLDFTTGVLDPRLTFDRLSTATFINSSGLVQFANANLMTYSTPRASGSAWGTTGTVTWGSATITDPLGNATAQEVTFGTAASAIFNTAGTTVVSGITHTFSVWLRAASGTTNVRIGDANVGAVSTVTLTTTWQRFSCQYVASGTNDGGAIYSQTGTPSSTFYVWGAQVQPGSIVGELLETTGTLRRNIPRFDYDPTTLAPRGLLIEGSANNLMSYSEDFSNAAWTKSGTNGTMPLTGTAPDNNAASRLLEENTTSYAKHSLERSISISAGIHTFSVWLKEPSTNSRRYAHIQLADGQATSARYTIVADLQTGTIAASGANNGTAGAPTGTGHSITAYPGGWYRVTISMNHVSSPSYQAIVLGDSASLFGGNNQPFYSATTPYKGLLVWGAQLETGSGASSYIPTGASTGNRAADFCYQDGISSWFTSQSSLTMLVDATPRVQTSFPVLWILTDAGGGNSYQLYYTSSGTTNSYTTKVNVGFSGTGESTLASSVQQDTRQIIGYAIASGVGVRSRNGVSGTAAVPSSLPTTALTRLGVGSTGSGFQANAHIRRIKYWPYALTQDQLNGATTT